MGVGNFPRTMYNVVYVRAATVFRILYRFIVKSQLPRINTNVRTYSSIRPTLIDINSSTRSKVL